MQTLPAVVLAHQEGVGLAAYRREHGNAIPCKDPRFELRMTRIDALSGHRRMAWAPWRVGIPAPFRVYDVYASADPQVTEADLMAWLAERGM